MAATVGLGICKQLHGRAISSSRSGSYPIGHTVQPSKPVDWVPKSCQHRRAQTLLPPPKRRESRLLVTRPTTRRETGATQNGFFQSTQITEPRPALCKPTPRRGRVNSYRCAKHVAQSDVPARTADTNAYTFSRVKVNSAAISRTAEQPVRHSVRRHQDHHAAPISSRPPKEGKKEDATKRTRGKKQPESTGLYYSTWRSSLSLGQPAPNVLRDQTDPPGHRRRGDRPKSPAAPRAADKTSNRAATGNFAKPNKHAAQSQGCNSPNRSPMTWIPHETPIQAPPHQQ